MMQLLTLLFTITITNLAHRSLTETYFSHYYITTSFIRE